MAVIAAGLTSQNGYYSNTDRGLSVAMATADVLRCGLLQFGDAAEEVGSGGGQQRDADSGPDGA